MSIFGGNSTSLGDQDVNMIVAREGYNDVAGSIQIMAESFVNETKMFGYLIGRDFNEAVERQNGVYTESVEVLTEGASEIIAKIKAMIKKAWEKVKGLFKSFIAKFDSVIMRDTKALYNKHKKQWITNGSKKIKKYKFRKISNGNELDGEKSFMNIINQYKEYCYEVLKTEASDEDLDAKRDDASDGTFLDALLTGIVSTAGGSGSTDAKSFSKDFTDALFDDEETWTDEALNSDVRSQVDILMSSGAGKLLDKIKKTAKANDRIFVELNKSVEQMRKTILSAGTNGKNIALATGQKYANNKDKSIVYNAKTTDTGIKRLGILQSLISKTQQAVNMADSCYLSAAKMHVAQCRRIFGQVTSGFGVKNESALLCEACGEAEEYDVYSSFEDYEY